MNTNRILRFASHFESLAKSELEKLPKDSSNQKTVLKNIAKLETYQARKKYAERNFKHLSSGSSRIVYLTPKKTVVKLAKNDKGIAQNKAEANPKLSESKYVNNIIGCADNFAWIETSFLKKMTAKQFKKATGIDFDDFDECIRYGLKSVSGSKKDKPDSYDEVSEIDFFKEIKELGEKFKLMPGDLAKESSWGLKDGKPTLIDTGLTKKVFEDYYES
jgi:hypothetical protein